MQPLVAFTCDDVSPETNAQKLRELLSAIDRFQVKATFFVIPRSHAQWNSSNAVAGILKDAQADGHEIALHGLSHYPFEIWSPFTPYGRGYSEIRKRILTGMEIMSEKLDAKPRGFRAPHHLFSRSLLQSLIDFNFLYDSSQISLQEALLSYIPPLRVLWYSRRHRLSESQVFHPMGSRMWEIPITHEFTWHSLKLEVNLFHRFFREDPSQSEAGCLVINSHINALTRWGLSILEELFAYIRRKSMKSMTMQEMAKTLTNTETKPSLLNTTASKDNRIL